MALRPLTIGGGRGQSQDHRQSCNSGTLHNPSFAGAMTFCARARASASLAAFGFALRYRLGRSHLVRTAARSKIRASELKRATRTERAGEAASERACGESEGRSPSVETR